MVFHYRCSHSLKDPIDFTQLQVLVLRVVYVSFLTLFEETAPQPFSTLHDLSKTILLTIWRLIDIEVFVPSFVCIRILWLRLSIVSDLYLRSWCSCDWNDFRWHVVDGCRVANRDYGVLWAEWKLARWFWNSTLLVQQLLATFILYHNINYVGVTCRST
jgi:hypothetical protein